MADPVANVDLVAVEVVVAVVELLLLSTHHLTIAPPCSMHSIKAANTATRQADIATPAATKAAILATPIAIMVASATITVAKARIANIKGPPVTAAARMTGTVITAVFAVITLSHYLHHSSGVDLATYDGKFKSTYDERTGLYVI
ncbi:hypothetical protein H257_04772 [Aphanomyces astaci]|uniref:Uncharacterized protein n=1 Tax=Aphanomyces astaci TaxID=112090 RepID=W4GTF0_APHAT|nr:hypothetical protein H257_04772 [Aphanomyces astaci]ETV83030.1 hypothetical protein H257_04772 [Aphanomyces astaci]|eukprot:XP_009827701.1 hypothetical protein H257_04772 [Aphanomyces astaci]